MSEALAKIENGNGALAFGREQVDLIKRTIMPPDATDDELKLFLHVAKTSGLDPLRRQIHATKRNGKLTIIAGIDGLRARATREPDFEGLLHGVVCAKDTVKFDASTGAVTEHTYNPFAERGPIVGAWATVHRKGKLPFTANVKFSEFCQPASPTWKQMPAVMIGKVAQSTALRMAYPEQFSAIYEQAEMDQAEPAPTVNGAATSALKAKLAAVVVEAPPASPPRPSRMQIQDVEPEPAQEEPPPPSEEWPPAPEEPISVASQSDGERSKRTLVKFGRDKGKHICDVADLSWLKAAAKKAVEANDPKWHSKNLEWAQLIDEELARRDP